MNHLEPRHTQPKPTAAIRKKGQKPKTSSRRRRKKKNGFAPQPFTIGPQKPQKALRSPFAARSYCWTLLDHCSPHAGLCSLPLDHCWTIARYALASAGPLLHPRCYYSPSVTCGKARLVGAGLTIAIPTQPNSAFPRPLSAPLTPVTACDLGVLTPCHDALAGSAVPAPE